LHFVGSVGVGKTMLAQCLGSTAVRAGHSVLFVRADTLLADLVQARADRTYDKVFRRYLASNLVILDDFGLRRLNAQQSNDLYELIVERHRRASFCMTSNGGVDEWLAVFDDPILGNSALDPLANAAHPIVIEGPSYRVKLAPKHRVGVTFRIQWRRFLRTKWRTRRTQSGRLTRLRHHPTLPVYVSQWSRTHAI
jgi:DNA replication protein DnaC